MAEFSMKFWLNIFTWLFLTHINWFLNYNNHREILRKHSFKWSLDYYLKTKTLLLTLLSYFKGKKAEIFLQIE